MSTPRGDGYVVGFAVAVCLACSLVLSAAASALKAKQEYNVEMDRKLNVLKAFGYAIRDEQGRQISSAEVERIFREKIREIILDGETGQPIEGLTSADVDPKDVAARKRLPLYTYEENGEVVKYAIPISGKGLWSTIYGYLALNKDLATIAGVTFYKHGETPGLGGEVEKDWFQNNFKGKVIWRDGQRVPFEVVKGTVADRYPQGNDHAVDGISGATLTGKGVTEFINRDLDLYEKYFKLIRRS
ncbi:MAG: NADH:ubiquinone reductase (Na(+)-transporting) subunit C [Kiritimatiellae bacterium]|nr:NADH:ubiquinone reductase (Na(+)-transporting) subunit C [Kiritimatiellia bacterium]MDW8457648.1 NADH:ubiquinone reductase (Na(+)-transporting) subunit C [Verrucomicrobiota bacterium]